MTLNPLRLAVRQALYGSALAAALATPLAFAQSEDGKDATELDKIEVTGSRIKRADVETSQPVFVLSREELKATGLAQVGDILQNIATAGASINQVFNNGGDGTTTIDLRDLGSQRTLVLVNGRRFAPAGTALTGAVDLNTIPTSIVERIEVLKDGASTIYGSDAIAGVINIITVHDFDGMRANGYVGQNSKGDGETSAYDFTMGASTDRTSLVANISYQENKAISAGDREISRVPQYGADFCASSTSPTGRFGLAERSGTFTLVNGAPTAPGVVQDPNNIRAFVIPDDCYNFAPDNYLLTPQERFSAYGQLHHNLTDDLTFYSEFVYTNKRSEQLLAAIPVTFASSGLFGDNVAFDVSPDSYYNPFGVRTTRVQRRLNETGGRSFNQDVDVWHYAGGVEGTFELGDRMFNWDVGYTYSQNQENDQTFGQVNVDRIRQAVGPSFRDAQGNLLCGTPDNVISGCVPLNIFGGEGSITPDMLNYITSTLQDTFEYKRIGYTANLSGDLFELPGGMLAFATGYEYRNESGYDLPDALTATGLSSGNIRQPTQGGFAVDEYYLELSAPLLSDMAFAKSLELSLASRYSDYTTFGDTTNSKLGIRWQPIDDLVIRGNWSESFRAPSINELYLGQSDSFPTFSDPCAGAGQAVSNRFDTLSAEQQARCLAAGVPAGGAQQASGQIRSTVGGNPNLQPEDAVTKTVGLVYSPSWFEGFDVSLDWYRIELDDTITTQGAQIIADACIMGGVQQACNLITRLPGTGDVIGLLDINLNGASSDVEGYDLTANYRFDTDYGSFHFVWDTTYLAEYTDVYESGIPGQPLVYENPGNYNYGRGNTFQRIRSNLTMNWEYGDFGATWGVRYRSKLEENCSDAADPEIQCSNPNGFYNVDGLASNGMEQVPTNILGARVYNDLQGRWRAPWDATVSIGVRNAFDKDPPVSISTFANSFDPSYDVPGRFYYVSYSQNF